MNRPGTVIGFINAAHFIDHYAMLVFAAAVIVMGPIFGVRYGDLLPYATPGFVAFGAGSLLAGWLGDHWSRRHMMVIFFAGIGAATVAVGLVRTPFQLGAALLAVGVFASIYHPVGTAMLVSHADRLGREVGLNGVWGNLGVASSALVTSVICQTIGWRWAFILPGLAALAIGIAFATCVRHETRVGLQQANVFARVKKQAMRRVVAALAITVIASSATFNAITVALPKLFAERLTDVTANPALIGLTVSGVYLFGALAQYAIGGLIDRHSLKSVFLPLSLLLAPLLFLSAGLTGLPLIVVSIGVIIGIFGQVTVNDAMVGKYTSDEWRARAYAARYFLGFTAAGASVGLVAWLHETGGFSLVLRAFGGLCLLIICGALVFPDEERSDQKAALFRRRSGVRITELFAREGSVRADAARGFSAFVPAVPKKVFVTPVGDQAQRVSHLFFVKVAERALLRHAAVHFMRFRRTGGAAKMTDDACVAARDVFDLAADHPLKRRAFDNVLDRLAKNIAAVEGGDADEFAAREQVAAGSEGEKASTAAAGRNVAHQPSRRRRQNGDQDIGEIGDNQLASGFQIELMRSFQCGDIGRRHLGVAATNRAGARQRAAGDVEHAGGRFPLMQKLHHPGQMRQILRCHGADDIVARIAFEHVHGADDVIENADAAPLSARAIGDFGDGPVERQADANSPRRQEGDSLLVKQRGVGLNPEAKPVAIGFNPRENGFARQQRFGAMEDHLGQSILRHMAAKISVKPLQRLQNFPRLHLLAASAHVARDVAIGAVQVAAFGRVEIDRRRFQVKPQQVHFAREACAPGPQRIAQGAARQRFGEAVFLHEAPECGVRLDHGDVGGMRDVEGAERKRAPFGALQREMAVHRFTCLSMRT